MKGELCVSLGSNLYALRKSRKWTQGYVAERIGVSRQAVSKWELDESVPDITKLNLLSELFNVSTDELLTETPANIVKRSLENRRDSRNAGDANDCPVDNDIPKNGEPDTEESDIPPPVYAELTAVKERPKYSLFRAAVACLIGIVILGTMSFVSTLVPAYVDSTSIVTKDDIVTVEAGGTLVIPDRNEVTMRLEIDGDFFAFLNTYRLHWLAIIGCVAIIYGIINTVFVIKHEVKCAKLREEVVNREYSEEEKTVQIQ